MLQVRRRGTSQSLSLAWKKGAESPRPAGPFKPMFCAAFAARPVFAERPVTRSRVPSPRAAPLSRSPADLPSKCSDNWAAESPPVTGRGARPPEGNMFHGDFNCCKD